MNSNKRLEVLEIFAEHGKELNTRRVLDKHMIKHGRGRGGHSHVSEETVRLVRHAIWELQSLQEDGMDAAAVLAAYAKKPMTTGTRPTGTTSLFIPTLEFIELALTCKSCGAEVHPYDKLDQRSIDKLNYKYQGQDQDDDDQGAQPYEQPYDWMNGTCKPPSGQVGVNLGEQPTNQPERQKISEFLFYCLRSISGVADCLEIVGEVQQELADCLEIVGEEKDKLAEQWATLNNWQDQLEDYHNQLKAERGQLGQPAQLIEDYQPTNWKEF